MPYSPNPTSLAASVSSAPSHDGHITLDQLVNLCIEKEASDIHFREGGRLALRIGGKIVFIESVSALSKEEAGAMLQSLLLTPEERTRFEKEREMDFSYTHTNGVNFRVNLFYQREN